MIWSHAFIKSFISLTVLLLYLWGPRERVFNYIRSGFYLAVPGVLVFYSWFNPRGVIPGTWRYFESPLIYLVFILVLEYVYRSRTGDPGFSLLMSINSAILAGYLYEVPRWLDLGARLIRFNINSIYWVDPAFVASIQIPIMLIMRGWKPKKIHLVTGLIYLMYFNLNGLNDHLQIIYLRIPAMVLLYSLSLGI